MVDKKLNDEDCKKIAKLIDEGHEIKDLARKYNVDRNTISRRCKDMYQSRKIPIIIRNKVIKAIRTRMSKEKDILKKAQRAMDIDAETIQTLLNDELDLR